MAAWASWLHSTNKRQPILQATQINNKNHRYLLKKPVNRKLIKISKLKKYKVQSKPVLFNWVTFAAPIILSSKTMRKKNIFYCQQNKR